MPQRKLLLTDAGKGVLAGMIEQYGPEKGEEVFYASINDKNPGSKKWYKRGSKPKSILSGRTK